MSSLGPPKKRDLALCTIVAIETPHAPVLGELPTFCSIGLVSLSTPLEEGAEIVCIGQLGCDDLEFVVKWKTR